MSVTLAPIFMRLSFDTGGRALEEEDAPDQHLGMLHLVDGLLLEGLVQLLEAPVGAHLRVHHMHTDGRQLFGKTIVQKFENLRMTFHGSLLWNEPAG